MPLLLIDAAPAYPCEALAFIQIGINGLVAQGYTDALAEDKAEADKLGKAWLALGTRHANRCECPNQGDMAEAMKVQLEAYLAIIA